MARPRGAANHHAAPGRGGTERFRAEPAAHGVARRTDPDIFLFRLMPRVTVVYVHRWRGSHPSLDRGAMTAGGATRVLDSSCVLEAADAPRSLGDQATARGKLAVEATAHASPSLWFCFEIPTQACFVEIRSGG